MYYKRKRSKGKTITFICLVVLFFGLVYGYVNNDNKPLTKPYGAENNSENKEKVSLKDNNDNNKKIDDKNNYEEVSLDKEEEIIDSKEEQDIDIVTHDTEIIFNTYYKKTGEIKVQRNKVPITVIGLRLKEFKEYIENNYNDWVIKNISTKAVTLFQERDELPPNYYIIQGRDGYIVIYKIDNNGKKVLYEETDIPLSVLSEIDKKKLQEGILVKTLEEANNVIEDYSS